MTAILKDALKSIIGPTLKSLFSWDSRLIDLKEIEYHLAGHNQLNERCLVDGYKCALVCLMCKDIHPSRGSSIDNHPSGVNGNGQVGAEVEVTKCHEQESNL